MSLVSQPRCFIYALHGFLGQGSDWTEVFSHSIFKKDRIIAPSFFSDKKYQPLSIHSFIQDVRDHQQSVSNVKKIFIGYSLGGRIGLQMLDQQPDLFDEYIFVSTHPGLKSALEKTERIKTDEAWAEQLQQLNWDDFLKKWNTQEVLSNSLSLNRNLLDFQIQSLRQALRDFSLGAQKDYSDIIAKHQEKIHWVVGTEDKKFLSLTDTLEQKKILLNIKRIFSGHRILLDSPKELQEILLALEH